MKSTTAVNETLWLPFFWPKETLINHASQGLRFQSSLQYAEPDSNKVTSLDMQGASFRGGGIETDLADLGQALCSALERKQNTADHRAAPPSSSH